MFLTSRSVQQVAALPFVMAAEEPLILLITSRRSGKWGLPKGWPGGSRSLIEAARQEALEEAGLEGLLHSAPVGSYSYTKNMRQGYPVPCEVFVFPLAVTFQRLSWPERTERKLRWVRLATAPGLVKDAGLKQLLARLAEDDGKLLGTLASDLNFLPDGAPNHALH